MAQLGSSGRAASRQLSDEAAALLELDDTAGHLDYQLKNWLINANCGGGLLLVSASVCEQGHLLINLLRFAHKNLPKDSGRARPMDEDRFIIYLEASGGRALAYRDLIRNSGYALTPFRNFMHQLYDRLQLASRRTESGLDEAIIRALAYRRKHRKECLPLPESHCWSPVSAGRNRCYVQMWDNEGQLPSARSAMAGDEAVVVLSKAAGDAHESGSKLNTAAAWIVIAVPKHEARGAAGCVASNIAK
jgi:hypothetical protein